jgi:tRNA (mo5U34)-methyltransferase
MKSARFMVQSAGPTASPDSEAAAYAPWFHNLHLPDGSQTAPDHPLGDFPAFKWAQIASVIPEDLDGWTALDVGCNAGFYSFELAKRGARVSAIDMDPHFLRQAAWAAREFDLVDRIDFHQASVYDLAAWSGKFDLILFMGVFYHLRHPLLALDILAIKTGRRMIFQTLSLPGEEVATTPEDQDFDHRETMLADAWPKMAFVEKSLAGDPTNWWVPNRAAVEAMLRSAGLAVIGHPGHEIYICETGSGPNAAVLVELSAATGSHHHE